MHFGPAELSLYSLCTVRARLGRCCVILIFSPSGSHFGETGGAFFALYGIAPRASAVYGRSLGGVFLRYMVSARRLEMRKSSHSVAFSIRPCGPPSPYCTMSGGHLIMLVKRIICDLMISNASTHWPSFIVHTLWSVSRFNVQTAPEGGLQTVDIASRSRMSVPAR